MNVHEDCSVFGVDIRLGAQGEISNTLEVWWCEGNLLRGKSGGGDVWIGGGGSSSGQLVEEAWRDL